MPKVSLVIITKNEEKNIKDCIFSALDLVDEIIVLDEFSTDRTVEIAEGFGAKVFTKEFMGFGQQKQYAVSLASHDWVLCLDADEQVSDDLANSILNWKNKKEEDGIKGYSFNRLSFYCGKGIKTCGWYPVNRIRLFNRKFGNWNDKDVHEIVELNPEKKEGFLKGDLMHYTMETVEEHIAKTKKYALIKSENLQDKNKLFIYSKLIFNPISVFIKMYFLKFGFMDGWRGYSISKISAMSEVWIYKYTLDKMKKGT